MDAATKAATALQKAQATGIYAGLGLWPKEVMAGLVAGQLAGDGIYPDAGAAFAAGAQTDDSPQPVRDYSPDQPRDPQGQWTEGGGGGSGAPNLSTTMTIQAGVDPANKLSETHPEPKISVNQIAGEASLPSQNPSPSASVELAQASCADFIAANCKAGILRVFPGEYLDQPLSKVYEDAANGSAAAREAKKLLQQDRFRK